MSVSRPTDAEAIGASLLDAAAFEAVFDRHFPAISRYLRRRLPAATADELAAEVFTTAFAARRSYDLERESALPWLYGIAANLIRRHVREEERELRSHAFAPLDPASVAGAEPADTLLRRVLEPRLARALANLVQHDREVLLLFAWANLGYEDIARALELPVGTVKSRLNRARAVVRAALEASDPVTKEAANG